MQSELDYRDVGLGYAFGGREGDLKPCRSPCANATLKLHPWFIAETSIRKSFAVGMMLKTIPRDSSKKRALFKT